MGEWAQRRRRRDSRNPANLAHSSDVGEIEPTLDSPHRRTRERHFSSPQRRMTSFRDLPQQQKISCHSSPPHINAPQQQLTFNSSPSFSKNMAKWGNAEVLKVSTLESLLLVVIPLKVKTRSFFPNGAIPNNGSKYHPILLPSGQVCTNVPPASVPGWKRNEVPV